jgi:hypothetical protein
MKTFNKLWLDVAQNVNAILVLLIYTDIVRMLIAAKKINLRINNREGVKKAKVPKTINFRNFI